ncbi:MAG TPA: hypothetical protein VFL91_17765 [Thermomicrobiales bacterium]|nr:hypothetical protein [Thermomicrobiales bacterium]
MGDTGRGLATAVRPAAGPFAVERLGVVWQADPTVAAESGGLLNPAAARGPDGALYLLPRIVGERNYSRIGLARVRFDAAGRPAALERLGDALEPAAPYERRPSEATGGCEDPRVVRIAALGCYAMAYTAWGDAGPRVAIAVSPALRTWRRLGLLNFAPDPDPVYGVDFRDLHNKDGAFFPEPVTAPDGSAALGLLHRPVYGPYDMPAGVADPRPSVWLSYCDLAEAQRDLRTLATARQHHPLLTPRAAWEALRVGAGPPPLATPWGWALLYHGVSGRIARVAKELQPVEYAAGVAVLDRADVRRVRYRSPEPILRPETADELEGVVPNVVFPTGLDDRGDGRVDVYYGMADLRIGVARLRPPPAPPAPDAG